MCGVATLRWNHLGLPGLAPPGTLSLGGQDSQHVHHGEGFPWGPLSHQEATFPRVLPEPSKVRHITGAQKHACDTELSLCTK